jgi:hypothetical protein
MHKEVLLSLKMEGTLLFVATWMSLEDIRLSEISWTQKDPWNLKKLNQ